MVVKNRNVVVSSRSIFAILVLMLSLNWISCFANQPYINANSDTFLTRGILAPPANAEQNPGWLLQRVVNLVNNNTDTLAAAVKSVLYSQDLMSLLLCYERVQIILIQLMSGFFTSTHYTTRNTGATEARILTPIIDYDADTSTQMTYK